MLGYLPTVTPDILNEFINYSDSNEAKLELQKKKASCPWAAFWVPNTFSSLQS
jgi:hypothetical protein